MLLSTEIALQPAAAMTPYTDRHHAGRVLAEKLRHLAGNPGLVILALPRGGVPVAAEVAATLKAPLDIFVVRKLGMPGQPELAVGAIASGGITVMNDALLAAYPVPTRLLDAVRRTEEAELARRERLYRGGRPATPIAGRTVVLVDDGLATGASMRAAVVAVRRLNPARVIVAVPVGARDSCAELRAIADEVVCAATPEPFAGVGQWYRDFSQTSDDTVRTLLSASAGVAGPEGTLP
jgi:predicted phosphoribosyltransferase